MTTHLIHIINRLINALEVIKIQRGSIHPSSQTKTTKEKGAHRPDVGEVSVLPHRGFRNNCHGSRLQVFNGSFADETRGTDGE